MVSQSVVVHARLLECFALCQIVRDLEAHALHGIVKITVYLFVNNVYRHQSDAGLELNALKSLYVIFKKNTFM